MTDAMKERAETAPALLPCPMCGGKAHSLIEIDEHIVWCIDCGTMTNGFDTEAEAIAAWNRRATATPPKAPGVVTVKPLEWRYYPDAFPPAWDAETPFGRYSIEETNQSDTPGYEVSFRQGVPLKFRDSLPEAKALAQTDYQRRILSTLVSTPPVSAGAGTYLFDRFVNGKPRAEDAETVAGSEAEALAKVRKRYGNRPDTTFVLRSFTPSPPVSGEVGELVEPVATQYRYRHKNPSAIWSAWGEHNAALALCLDYECERRELVPASALTAANADRDRLEKELAAALKDGAVQFETSLSHEERAETLARELEEARAALKPFAAIAEEGVLINHPDSYAPRPSKGRPNMGDFRRARDAYRPDALSTQEQGR